MIKALHIALAFLTVSGIIMRTGWSYVSPDLLQDKWVRMSPHIIDTTLLILGVFLALQLSGGVLQEWLIAKMVGLLAYIDFGVLTLRGQGKMKQLGLVGALSNDDVVYRHQRTVFRIDGRYDPKFSRAYATGQLPLYWGFWWWLVDLYVGETNGCVFWCGG